MSIPVYLPRRSETIAYNCSGYAWALGGRKLMRTEPNLLREV